MERTDFIENRIDIIKISTQRNYNNYGKQQ